MKPITLEETMKYALRCYGPLIAIGRPEEKLSPAGAAREYLEEDNWQERVEQYIKSSQIIVSLLGDTDGLAFEYQRVVALGSLNRLILIFPPSELEQRERQWHQFLRAVSLDHEVSAEELKGVIAATFTKEGVPWFLLSSAHEDDAYHLALRIAASRVATCSP